MSNEDTSDRIKRTQDNRFGNGGLLRPPIFGIDRIIYAKADI